MDELLERAARRISEGSKSFAAAAKLLPPAQRASVRLLYTWCRHCDDVIDGEVLGFPAIVPGPSPYMPSRKTWTRPPLDELAALIEGTEAALAGAACEPEFVALQRVVALHRIPPRYPRELLTGMAMDARGASFNSIDDTLTYCYHVAGVVGVMTAIIMGARDAPTLERASDLGIAFQLTNIARDVVVDAERGRVYLPTAWLEAEGLDRSSLCDRSRRDALFRVVQRLIALSDRYYASALTGIAALPFRSAVAVATARRVYRGIGERILATGPASWSERIVTSRREKTGAAVRALGDTLTPYKLRCHEASREGLWTPQALIA
jgi:phytoene synthase